MRVAFCIARSVSARGETITRAIVRLVHARVSECVFVGQRHHRGALSAAHRRRAFAQRERDR